MHDGNAWAPEMAAALVRAAGRVEAVSKASRNDHQRYDYTSAEQMISICSRALHAEGLTLLRTGVRMGEPYQYTQPASRSSPERTMTAIPVISEFALVHQSGAVATLTAELPACPEAGRPADKAALGAQTEALGYVLRDLLLVARGYDAHDVSGRVDDTGAADVAAQPAVNTRQEAAQVPGADETEAIRELYNRMHGVMFARYGDQTDGILYSLAGDRHPTALDLAGMQQLAEAARARIRRDQQQQRPVEP